MASAFLALSIWVWSALAKASALAPWPSWVASWLEAPKLKVTFASGLAVWKALAMSWKTSVSDEAANTTISPETGAAAAGFDAAVGWAAGAVVGSGAGAAVGAAAGGAHAAMIARISAADATENKR